MKNIQRFFSAAIIGLSTLFLTQPVKAEPIKLNMVFVPASEKGDDKDYTNLIKIIEKLAKIEIKPIRVTDYNAAVEAMRAGRAQIAWYGGKTIYMQQKLLMLKLLLQEFEKVIKAPDTTHILWFRQIAQ